MNRFARLFRELDETNRTRDRVRALIRYFSDVPPEDACWAVSLLCGHRPRRAVTLSQLRRWCAEVSGVPEWLFEESYDFVGDLAETIALLLPPPAEHSGESLHWWIEQRLLPLKNLGESAARQLVIQSWSELEQRQRLIFNKLLTGGFRVGVSQKLVVRALAEMAGLDVTVVTHRLMGPWAPTAQAYLRLINPATDDADISRPWPFALANALAADVEQPERRLRELGRPQEWLIEWKWDGIRAQIIHRGGQVFIWSRGEELLTERFPELLKAVAELPAGTVLDGEIIVFRNGLVAPFADLQRRIGRKSVGRKIMADYPVRFLAFDLLEQNGIDLRLCPLSERRRRLEELLSQSTTVAIDMKKRQRLLFEDEPMHAAMAEVVAEQPIASNRPRSAHRGARPVFENPERRLMVSPLLQPVDWHACVSQRAGSRNLGAEGLMIKRADAAYPAGRVSGVWWKWKTEPFSCDAVLVYAQRGHGRRSGLYTDYTFAAWQAGELVPFAKAYSGLTDAEIKQVDRFVQQNTVERFGPVRRVRPELVFELAFEGLQSSGRHKSGIALRFPRILRWRTDKKPADADTVERILALVNTEG